MYIFLLADSCALMADAFEEVCRRGRLVNTNNLLINARHAANTTALKDECLVVGNFVHDVEAAKLDPLANWGAMVDCNDVRPKAMDEIVRLHPWKIWQVFIALKS